MCGIAGIISTRDAIAPETLIAMRDRLSHRGPDDVGVWCSTGVEVGLVHRRLSIIDLSAQARQPMASASGRSRIVFNGEIYNYRELRQQLELLGRCFRSASDTEVLLEAYEQWGLQFLERLNGMFAFGLFDSATRQIVLARDRAGEKPLFYRHAGRRLTFASELKALLADDEIPRRLSHEALEYYLAFGYVPGAMCLLEGVHKVRQGHVLVYELDNDRVRTWPYWQLPEESRQPNHTACDGELAEQLQALLCDSVRLRLNADVPVGVLLSGGLDSSMVTAMAARVAGKGVKTFTISFPGHAAYDEAPYARTVAEHFETEHTELAAPSATVDLLPELARQYDEPIADSSMVPTYLVSREIRRHAAVALGGDGGDELFGGYPYYSWLQIQDAIRRRVPSALRRALERLGRQLPLGVRGRSYLLGVGLNGPGSLAQFNLFFDYPARQRLLRHKSAGLSSGPPPELFKVALCRKGATVLQQATEVDFQTYLVDDILVKVDRASMLASLEVRAPWLDPRLIEFGYTLPDRLRATSRERKVLVRALARNVLPSTLDLDRKQGFSLPLNAWFKGDWGAYFEEVLREADGSLFNRTMIDGLITAQRRGLGNTHRLFALTFFELWRRHYGVSLG